MHEDWDSIHQSALVPNHKHILNLCEEVQRIMGLFFSSLLFYTADSSNFWGLGGGWNPIIIVD